MMQIGQMTIEVDGVRYELPQFDKPTIREAKAIKVATGFAPMELMDALQNGDPDAWGGLVLLAMRRVHPNIGAEAVENLDLFALMEAFDAELSEDPPTVAAGAAETNGQANSSTPEPTPATSGTPSSAENSEG